MPLYKPELKIDKHGNVIKPLFKQVSWAEGLRRDEIDRRWLREPIRRKINGKTFEEYAFVFNHDEAKNIQKRLQNEGYFARIEDIKKAYIVLHRRMPLKMEK